MSSLSRKALAAAFILMSVSGCGDVISIDPAPDLWKVLDRTVRAMDKFHRSLETRGVTIVTDAHMDEFTGMLHASLNGAPRFYGSAIGVSLRPDASFEGFRDLNANTVQETDENRIFTIEIDVDNNRLIATDTTGTSTGYRVSGGGFFAGAFVGSLINRQRAAGVKPGTFDKRDVASRSAHRNTGKESRSSRRSARSSSRSGSHTVGK